ncbi:YdeI/OmpD-associated family protein [Aquihabitans sp. G128]|uniref:YdeI/OmpD-associated family protein n=1 Tax=Aquihabitans sp. G128 TaxID=2849779 RepID=UPI001C245D9E|nr:YdeI/OmpD-associated family protein [Aquihabitans sp. G128]QXC61403.1 YdeI/OmpD-associated family protein [Aquihabitans sp. G128]
MRFRTTIELGGKTATGIPVPDDVVAALGGGKRAAVSVTVNGFTYTSTLGVMGGRSLVPLSAERRTAAGVAAGDEVEVDLVLDAAPREIEVPPDLAAALDADPAVRAAFDGLAPSRRKEWVRSVTEAKQPETRERRIAKAVESVRSA